MTEVSVLIVVRNEEKYIIDCIRSIELQFEKTDSWELIIVDGNSTDRTKYLVQEYLQSADYQWMLVDNENKTLAPGWNIGIKKADSKYLIRPDAHASFQKGYIKNGIATLEKMQEVSAVGGVLETKSNGFWGNIIKVALSSKVGVGNSSFRTSTRSGFTDTAVYAVYRKDIFDEVGLFDEKLVRHQDNDMHHRIRKAGGKLYLNTKMKADYYCRESIPKLCKQMFNIGKYLPDVMFNGSLSIRHLLPFVFYASMIIGLLLGWLVFKPLLYLSLMVFGAYIFTILIESIIKSFQKRDISLMFLLFVIPLIHINYALGTFLGFFRILLH